MAKQVIAQYKDIPVYRLSLTKDEITEIVFKDKAVKWGVKNLSENDLFVSFSENAIGVGDIKIMPQWAEEVYTKESASSYFNSIFVKGNGQIEVRQL